MSAPTRTRRSKRAAHGEEEHENSERWLLTYADMITLLMVLFIVLFAISQVDQKKFNALKDGLAVGFGAPSPTFDGNTGTIDSGGAQNEPLDLASSVGTGPKDAETQQMAQQVHSAVQAADRARADQQRTAAEKEAAKLAGIERRIHQALVRKGLANSVRFTIDERGLVVTVVTSKVVFAGDLADLLPAGQQILDAISPVLRPLPNSIEVDGNTNQLPVPTVNYPSAWELSASRAASVVRYFIHHQGIAPHRLSAVGFGDQRPLYPPSDPRSVTMNRRVDIVVQSTLSPAARALLPAVAPAQPLK